MADLNEIQGQPQEQNEHEARPKGIGIFMGDATVAYLTRMGRHLSEDWLRESFILYRVDLSKTTPNFYGESKKKSYKEPIEIFGRLDIESTAVGQQTPGGVMKRGTGTMTANVYLQHLDELGLTIKKDLLTPTDQKTS